MDVSSPLSHPLRSEQATQPPAVEPPKLERFLSKAEVRRITSLSPTTIQRAINAGTFPQPIPLSHNRVGFAASEIAAWQRTRIAARDSEHAAA